MDEGLIKKISELEKKLDKLILTHKADIERMNDTILHKVSYSFLTDRPHIFSSSCSFTNELLVEVSDDSKSAINKEHIRTFYERIKTFQNLTINSNELVVDSSSKNFYYYITEQINSVTVSSQIDEGQIFILNLYFNVNTEFQFPSNITVENQSIQIDGLQNILSSKFFVNLIVSKINNQIFSFVENFVNF